MEGWAFLFFVVTIWAVIGSIQRRVRGKGHGWAAQFIAAWPLGFLAGFLVFGLVIDESGIARAIGLVLGGAALLNLMTRLSDRLARSKPIPMPRATEQAPLPTIYPLSTAADSEAIVASRKASLAAIKQATAARKRDMKIRGEKSAMPLMLDLPSMAEMQSKQQRHRPEKAIRQVKRKRLDTIQFDYLDAADNYSTRRVVVNQVDEYRFEGIDTDKQETRTFRLDRVVGHIMSEETGEIMDAEDWAESLFDAAGK